MPPLPIEKVIALCEENTRLYKTRDSSESDPTYCYELIKRVITERDKFAIGAMYRIYTPEIDNMLRRRFALKEEQYESYLEDGWDHLMDKMTISVLIGRNLAQVRRWMNVTVYRKVQDILRKENRRNEVETDLSDKVPSHENIEDAVASKLAGAKANDCYESVVSNAMGREQTRLRCVGERYFIYDERPREIVAQYPHLFDSTEDFNNARRKFSRRMQKCFFDG